MHNNKNILIVIPSLTFWWWAEKVAVDLWNDFYNDWYNINYLTFHKDKKTYEYKWKHIKLNQSKNNFLKILYIPINSYKVYKYCKKNNIDVIISHYERANIISIITKIFLKDTKQVSVVHNYKYSLSSINKILIKLFYKYSDKIVCVSKTIEKMLYDNFKLKNLTTIYNSFDFDSINKLSIKNIEKKDEKYFNNNDFVFLNIWRLEEQKWQEFLIKSFYELYKKNKNIKLIILWEWSLREELQNLINKLWLENNIFLLWRRENVYSYIKKSNAFVFSSLWEWFWLVLVEALSQWKPIISTDCKAWPREILAPELDLNKNIQYPYVWKYWVMTDTFEDDKSIENYSKVMGSIINWEYKFEKWWIKRFDKNITMKEWEKLINW